MVKTINALGVRVKLKPTKKKKKTLSSLLTTSKKSGGKHGPAFGVSAKEIRKTLSSNKKNKKEKRPKILKSGPSWHHRGRK